MDMEARHTPGPWEIEYDNGDNLKDGQWYNVGPAKIEFPYNCKRGEDAFAKADAHLISAAPDLLEAATQALAWIEKTVQLWDGLAMPDCAGTLEEAIAKATQEP